MRVWRFDAMNVGKKRRSSWKQLVACAIGLLLWSGCATTPSTTSGTLGQSPYRNVVVLGEHVNREIAQHYANTYNARVLYTSSQGAVADAVSDSLRGTLGPSRAMRDFIRELRSLNGTAGTWTIIIPHVAEQYFLVTLRNMEEGCLSQTQGVVKLLDATGNAAIEQEVQRVSHGAFVVERQ